MIHITNKTDCCGCTACINICQHHAISMKTDAEGFLYPIINTNLCTNCNLCEKVCPIIYRNSVKNLSSPIALFAARHKDNKILMNSSSGGAFSAIASTVIQKGGVICGVEYSPFMEVRHAFAESLEECQRFRGSKYVQSNLNDTFIKIKSYLKADRYVLFIGTPCQVEGLKLFLRKPYDKLITADIVCHAVPSPLIFQNYVSMVNKKMRSKLININMRDKKEGWSHMYLCKYSFIDGRNTYTTSNKFADWNRIYFSQLVNRPSCHECKFTNFNRPGDFTIADFWDDTHNRPDLYSAKGTSLICINSEKSKNLINELKNKLDMWPVSEKDALQPCLIKPTPASPLRKQFWNNYHRFGFRFVYWKYFTTPHFVHTKQIINYMLSLLHLRNRNHNK